MTPRHNQFTGCLLGLALGDAISAALSRSDAQPEALRQRAHAILMEGADVSEVPPLIVEDEPQPFGQITQHTQLARALTQALVDCGATLRREHLVRLIRRLYATRGLVFASADTRAALSRLANGTPWLYAGAPAPCVESVAITRAPILGLAFVNRPETLTPVAIEQTLLTHNNPITSAAVAACAHATRLALQDSPTPRQTDFWTAVARAADRVPHVIVCDDTAHTTVGTLILDLFTQDAPDFSPDTHSDTLAWLQTLRSAQGLANDAAITALWGLRAFWLAPDEPVAAITHALWPARGDISTAATLAGALSGARAGLPALPQKLILTPHDRGDAQTPDLLMLARTLFDQASVADAV